MKTHPSPPELNIQKSGTHSPQNQNIRIGLALSSGGARGLAHIGVLEVLQEHGIHISAISGASMGAYIGSHYASGITTNQMKEYATHMKDKAHLWKIADPIIPPVQGFFRGEKAAQYLRESIGDPDFADLQIPLYVITFDLDTQEKLVIEQGNVAHAVHASCAIPGIISPVEWNGHRCSDGGVVDPVPVRVLQEKDLDLIIAVSLLPSLSDIRKGEALSHIDEDPEILHKRMIRSLNQKTNVFAKGNTVDILRSSIRAAQAQIADLSCQEADFTIRPKVYQHSWHAFSELDSILEVGRQATKHILPALKEKIQALEHSRRDTLE